MKKLELSGLKLSSQNLLSSIEKRSVTGGARRCTYHCICPIDPLIVITEECGLSCMDDICPMYDGTGFVGNGVE